MKEQEFLLKSIHQDISELELNNRINQHVKRYNQLPSLILVDAISLHNMLNNNILDFETESRKSIFKYRNIDLIPVSSPVRFIYIQRNSLIDLYGESIQLRKDMYTNNVEKIMHEFTLKGGE